VPNLLGPPEEGARGCGRSHRPPPSSATVGPWLRPVRPRLAWHQHRGARPEGHQACSGGHL